MQICTKGCQEVANVPSKEVACVPCKDVACVGCKEVANISPNKQVACVNKNGSGLYSNRQHKASSHGSREKTRIEKNIRILFFLF